ncbi:GTP binding protein [Quillaja saponaria]|uniref:GTP binding protein n=1 Tax=Quillaja saponaria TaxID=32244 RepID=A0AAD7KQZ1_QUISA|nr:GTP binding protein [Quillaja saponaria]KAJ7944032.1 GTP binding protein [Quillaja saponaria]
MWPGMILKSGDRIVEPSLPEKEELSLEESDYELEYEILSASSADPWDDTETEWVSATALDAGPSTSTTPLKDEINKVVVPNMADSEDVGEPDEGKHADLEDLEQMMSEIGNMRTRLRLMPDFQSKEMAAKLAMKMAAMFWGSSDDEEV